MQTDAEFVPMGKIFCSAICHEYPTVGNRQNTRETVQEELYFSFFLSFWEYSLSTVSSNLRRGRHGKHWPYISVSSLSCSAIWRPVTLNPRTYWRRRSIGSAHIQTGNDLAIITDERWFLETSETKAWPERTLKKNVSWPMLRNNVSFWKGKSNVIE